RLDSPGAVHLRGQHIQVVKNLPTFGVPVLPWRRATPESRTPGARHAGASRRTASGWIRGGLQRDRRGTGKARGAGIIGIEQRRSSGLVRSAGIGRLRENRGACEEEYGRTGKPHVRVSLSRSADICDHALARPRYFLSGGRHFEAVTVECVIADRLYTE